MISLERITTVDLDKWMDIQRSCFKSLYDKYQDEHSPYLESRDCIAEKLSRSNNYFYWVRNREEVVGFLRIQTNENQGWLGSIAILPNHQRKGYAFQAILEVEKIHDTIFEWDLCTIFQEKHLVRLYERCGYKQTHTEPEQEGMDLVYMKKKKNNETVLL